MHLTKYFKIMPKTNAERARLYRARKKAAQNKIKKKPMTSTERVRKFRARKNKVQVVSAELAARYVPYIQGAGNNSNQQMDAEPNSPNTQFYRNKVAYEDIRETFYNNSFGHACCNDPRDGAGCSVGDSMPSSDKQAGTLVSDSDLEAAGAGAGRADDMMEYDDELDTYLRFSTEPSRAAVRCSACDGIMDSYRYMCVQCPDSVMCGACERAAAHADHYVLRVPRRPRPPEEEVEAVLVELRKKLFPPPIPSDEASDDDDDEVKIDIKEECVPEEQTVAECDPLAEETDFPGAGTADFPKINIRVESVNVNSKQVPHLVIKQEPKEKHDTLDDTPADKLYIHTDRIVGTDARFHSHLGAGGTSNGTVLECRSTLGARGAHPEAVRSNVAVIGLRHDDTAGGSDRDHSTRTPVNIKEEDEDIRQPDEDESHVR